MGISRAHYRLYKCGKFLVCGLSMFAVIILHNGNIANADNSTSSLSVWNQETISQNVVTDGVKTPDNSTQKEVTDSVKTPDNSTQKEVTDGVKTPDNSTQKEVTDSVKTPDNSTQKEGADGVDTTVIDLKKLLMGGIDNRSNLFSVNLVQSTAYYSQEQVNNAIAIHSFLSSKGWTDNAIAGLLGNIVSESAIIPDKWEVGGGGGYGLVQWTPANKLIQWCNSQGMDWHTINAQCARINYELQNGIQFYPSRAYGINGKSYISSSLSPYTMGLIFLANYERPYDSNQPNRGNQAQYWYDYFNGDNESQASQGTQESGTYTFSQATNIRTSPSLSGQIVGRYSAGDSVSYNSKVQADGYTWLQYTTASGRSCYVAVLDSGSASQTSQGTQESGTYTFSQATNIRTSPSLSGQIVGRYSAGDSVSYNSKVQADGYTWLQYTTASGRSCYVAVLDSGSASQTSQGTQESGTYTFSQATNIRTSPSLSGQIVGRYSAGDSVSYNSKVQADGYTWLQYTTASGRSCYVAVLDSGSASQTSQGTQESGTYTFSQATNIRTSPSLSGQIVGRYSAGDSVSYNSKVQADGYTWLQYTTASGRSCYVAVLDSGSASQTSQGTQESGTYTFSQATNIRTSPSLSGQIVGRYSAGDSVSYNSKVQADGYTWLQYTTASGRSCYVAVLDSGSASQTSQGTQESGTYTFSQATNIRTSPSLSGQIVGRYSAGDSVSYNSKVQADGYTWLQYTTASGRSCYVAVLDSGSASQTSQGTQESGTYTFSQATNIRTSPSLSGQIVGRYSAGDSVSYNSKVQADGYTWLQYTTASGRSCYVAVL